MLIMKYPLLMFCLVLCFCYDEVENPCSNPPKLSKDELLFGVLGGVDSVIVSHSDWWLAVPVKDPNECGFWGRGSNPDDCNSNYCGSADLVEVQCPWFNVARSDGYTLIVSVDQNETGGERKQSVFMGTRGCSTGFSITQSAD
jgi:hypothetical protein